MFPIFTAMFTAMSEAFKSLTTFKKRQSESDVLKTKKLKTKAVEYAEELIFYIENKFDLSEDKKYQKLRKRFFKYN